MGVGLARWQGRVDERLDDHDRELHGDNGLVGRMSKLERTVDRLAVKVGVGAAIGGLLGGGLVTTFIYLALGLAPHHH